MKKTIKEIIEDLTEDVECDTEALIEIDERYIDEDLDGEFYTTQTTEEQLLAMIHLNKKFIKILEEIENA